MLFVTLTYIYSFMTFFSSLKVFDAGEAFGLNQIQDEKVNIFMNSIMIWMRTMKNDENVCECSQNILL